MSRVLFLALLLVLVVTTPPVIAQQGDSISLDAPNSVTAGDTAEITGHVNLRDRPGTWEQQYESRSRSMDQSSQRVT